MTHVALHLSPGVLVFLLAFGVGTYQLGAGSGP